MAWYRTGKITVQNGSRVVVGVGTDFIKSIDPGFCFVGPDLGVYEVGTIDSSTQLQLVELYRGVDAVEHTYAIWQTQGEIAALAATAAELLNTFGAYRQAFLDGDLVGQGLVVKGVLTDASQLPVDPEMGDTYFIGTVIYSYGGTANGWKTQNIAGVVPRGAWAAPTAYVVNDLVPFGGAQYRRIVAGTSAGSPDTDNVNWEVFVARGAIGPAGVTPRGAWAAPTAYVVNDTALYSGTQYRRKVPGTTAATPAADPVNWEVFAAKGADGLGQVQTVSGVTPDAAGNVALVKSNVGLANVDNTADLAKPLSTAVVTALAAKVGSPNRLINGSLMIDQRNSGLSQTFTAGAAIAYCVDRWYASCTGANITGQRVSATVGGYTFTGGAGNTGTLFGQRIESNNIADQVNLTVTHQIKLSSTSITSVIWTAYYANAQDAFSAKTQIATGTFTINSNQTVYAASFNTGAYAANGIAIEYTTGPLLAGKTLTYGAAQLEPGGAATAVDRRPYGLELWLSQRYFLNTYNMYVPVLVSGVSVGNLSFPATMRATPTVVSNAPGFVVSVLTVVAMNFYSTTTTGAYALTANSEL